MKLIWKAEKVTMLYYICSYKTVFSKLFSGYARVMHYVYYSEFRSRETRTIKIKTWRLWWSTQIYVIDVLFFYHTKIFCSFLLIPMTESRVSINKCIDRRKIVLFLSQCLKNTSGWAVVNYVCNNFCFDQEYLEYLIYVQRS